MKETKLVTNVKIEEDEQVLEARRVLVETKSPVELSAITKLSDIPVPSGLKIQNLLKTGSKPGSTLDVTEPKRRYVKLCLVDLFIFPLSAILQTMLHCCQH